MKIETSSSGGSLACSVFRIVTHFFTRSVQLSIRTKKLSKLFKRAMHTEKVFPGTPMNVKNEISSFAIDRGDCPRAESGLFE